MQRTRSCSCLPSLFVATKVLKHIVGVCSKFIEMDDLLIFFPEEQAKEALVVFDCDADGHISAEDLRDAVLQIYENR